MTILFFDTYIVASDKLESGGINNNIQMSSSLSNIRNRWKAYKWKKKIDVVKYTLCSYATMNWDAVIIRYECEDPGDVESFHKFCIMLFPNALIENLRSSSVGAYRNALSTNLIKDDDWVFFSPNNDHPYIGKPDDLENVISSANLLIKKYKDADIGIIFSHYTESQLDRVMSEPLWGHLGENFKKIVYADKFITATLCNKLCIDSIQIFKAKFLREIFDRSRKTGRLIRLEDTEFYLSKTIKSYIQVVPNKELCRHYDGYYHFFNPATCDICLPLFIPDGFFEGKIRLRYGFDDYLDGWININPFRSSPNECDMSLLLEDIPHFWLDRIHKLEKKEDFVVSVDKDHLPYYKNLKNPFRSNNIARNYFRSIVLMGRCFIAVRFGRRLKTAISRYLKRGLG